MSEPTPETDFHPVAGVASLLLPGLGQFVAGERRRGMLIGAAILSLFFGGILIGGIDVIDRREDRLWFLGQACVGPIAFAVDYAHQSVFKVRDVDGSLRSARPDEARGPGGAAVKAGSGQRPPNIKSLGKVNELGTLYSTLAGMMNIIVILDAFFPRKKSPARAGSGTP